MPEPADHRTEAEEWIAGAKANWTAPRAYDDPPIDPLDTIAPALLAIAHQLGAIRELITQALADDDLADAERTYHPPPPPAGQDPCPHDATRDNPDGSATCIRCGEWSRYGWHFGGCRAEDLDDTISAPHPPLSPSEG